MKKAKVKVIYYKSANLILIMGAKLFYLDNIKNVFCFNVGNEFKSFGNSVTWKFDLQQHINALIIKFEGYIWLNDLLDLMKKDNDFLIKEIE